MDSIKNEDTQNRLLTQAQTVPVEINLPCCATSSLRKRVIMAADQISYGVHSLAIC